MEQAPWKPILFAAFASFLLLMLIYFVALPKSASNQNIEKILEFEASTIAGRSEGKKVWEFKAAKGWVGVNQDITNLEDITSGTFYKDNEEIINDFTAEHVAAYRQSKLAEASGVKAQVAVTGKKNRTKRKFVEIVSDRFKYDPDQNKSNLSGKIKMFEKKTTLQAEQMAIDHEQGVSNLSGNIMVNRTDISLSSDNLTYLADDEEIIAKDNVLAKIKSREPTRIKADTLKMYVDENKKILADGSIYAVSGKKAAVADRAEYEMPRKRIILIGKVRTVIEKGRALIKPQTAEKLKDKKIRGLLEGKTIQYSDVLSLSTINGDYEAGGNVVVIQDNKEVKSNFASYSDSKETITLTGNVFLKEKFRWVSCQKVIISVNKKTLEAFGRVEAEFKL